MTKVSVVRVYIQEGEKHGGHNLMEEIFRMLHDQYKVHGVTAFRGIAGFGSKGVVRADDILALRHFEWVRRYDCLVERSASRGDLWTKGISCSRWHWA
ncbi:DUF190 domain-containing protein [Acidithiobacillus caldus]|uniref:DUF190 domain-containing protein n=1 Tax=Acidithiobacillus caldus TaxID=33059 RepID=UPI00122C1EF1|nr:DUF190 domain-containing protein [Acidithiobacillus caldus]QEM40752.1 DUF190 domain-containing protein [Acidithiobacillus caldus]